jgi:hypothetical protein
MKRILNSLLLAAIAGLAIAADAQAHGRRSRGDCAPDCAPAPCVTTAAPAPAPQYEERKVTRYKTVTKEREVTETVCRMIPRQENYTYTVCVPKTRQEVRKVTVQVPRYREVEYCYTALVPETVRVKRTVVECIPTYRDVEYTYTVTIPRIEKSIVKQTVMQRNVKHVVEDVKVCKMVRETHTDECGRCYTTCRPVYDTVKVTRCVVECVPIVKDVEVCRTVCERQERKGVRRVCDVHRQERVIDVNVVRCRTEERVGKRTVCDYVTEVRDQAYLVCYYEKQERVGVRTVYDRKEEQVTRKVPYTECVPYEETIRVPVSPVSHCASDCDSGCSRGQRCGIFRRCGH